MAIDTSKFCEMVEDDEVNQLVTEVVQTILDIPGVYEAVTLHAVKVYGPREMKELHNAGVPSLGDLAGAFIWNTLNGNDIN